MALINIASDPLGTLTDLTYNVVTDESLAVYQLAEIDGERRLLRFTESAAGLSPWVTVDAANNGQTLSAGRYILDLAGGAFTLQLDHGNGIEWLFTDSGDLNDNNVLLGTPGDIFHYVNPNNGDATATTGPFTLDTSAEVRIIGLSAPNEYQVSPDGRGGVSSVVDVQDVQSADFTATAGSTCHEWPVDVSASAPTSELTVTAPTAPAIGDCFAVFDSTVSCTRNRTIKVVFVHNLQSSAVDPFAVINTPGSRIEFVYCGAVVGWRVSSDIN